MASRRWRSSSGSGRSPCLNGHIHQVLQKVEGNVTFHTALSTAFPQPAPGTAPSPGPMKVEAERLRRVLGITSIRYAAAPGSLAIVDSSLAGTPVAVAGAGSENPRAKARQSKPLAANEVGIDNFSFIPPDRTVAAGTTVTWINRDDVPHRIGSADQKFPLGPVIDTDQRYSYTFATPGSYRYFCTIASDDDRCHHGDRRVAAGAHARGGHTLDRVRRPWAAIIRRRVSRRDITRGTCFVLALAVAGPIAVPAGAQHYLHAGDIDAMPVGRPGERISYGPDSLEFGELRLPGARGRRIRSR